MAEYATLREGAPSQLQSPLLDVVWKPDADFLQPSPYQLFMDHLWHEARSSKPSIVARVQQFPAAFGVEPSERVLIVVRDEPTAAIARITQSFETMASRPVLKANLGDIASRSFQNNTRVVLLIEVETPLLMQMTLVEMQAIKNVVSRARRTLWVTGGYLLRAPRPNMSIAFGFLRTMRLEQYPNEFGVLDIDYLNTSAELVGQAMISVLSSLGKKQRSDEEFILCSGMLYKDEVELEVLPVGLNAKDVNALAGKNASRGSRSCLEFTGVVRAIGDSVTELRPGDRAVVMAPRHFSTLVRVPLSCYYKLLPHENHLQMATVLLALAMALYALRHRACLHSKESVLIHSATGGLGQAAIRVANLIGATIFATAGTEEKRKYLHEVLGVAPDHIFASRDTPFVAGIMRETAGRGVDVVLNSLPGDLLRASWRCMAEFGRFVEVGKTDIADAGRLDMDVFGRSTNFSAFDLTDLYYSNDMGQNHIWSNPLPDLVFDPKAGEAENVLKVMPDRYGTKLSSFKTYLMVGCLGGIGRHFSWWMMGRGARSFIFIGRSGTDKKAASLLIDGLERAGARVKVIRGDVGNPDVAAAAVKGAESPIGGVIQAAMSLKESLFSEMDVSDWHLGLRSKVKGTWNLHRSLDAHKDQLDFFVMTSSITGSIGQATEGNYCAANGFLDTFARYRCCLGLPAKSIALGAIKGIGYFAKHPKVEKILLWQGFQAIDGEGVLQLVDLAISGCQDQPEDITAPTANPVFLTGLDVENPVQRVLEDPRVSSLAPARSGTIGSKHDAVSGMAGGMPKPIAAALSKGNGRALYTSVERVVADKLAALVQTPPEQVMARTKLLDIGMDSMLAVEARQQATLGIEIPTTEFMASTATVGEIGRKVAEGLGFNYAKN
ncbi:MAG: hypothetical protein Q9181_001927 [Wetmoreana brouardii]